MHGAQNQDSHAKMGVNSQCVQLLCLPALEGDDGMHYGCFDNGVCIVWYCYWGGIVMPTWITGISL